MNIRQRVAALEQAVSGRPGSGGVRNWTDLQLSRFLADDLRVTLAGSQQTPEVVALLSRLASGTATDADIELFQCLPTAPLSTTDLIRHFSVTAG